MSIRYTQFVSAAPDASAAVSGDLLALTRGGITYHIDATYFATSGGAGNVNGSGTSGTIPLWTASTTLGDSHITDLAAGITVAPGSGGYVVVDAGDGVLTDGGAATVLAGDSTSAAGGAVTLQAGSGGTSGGRVMVSGGDGETLGGGTVEIYAGSGVTSGGNIFISAGDSASAGGNVQIDAGFGDTPGVQGLVQITGGGIFLSCGPGTTSGYNVIINAGSGFAALPGGTISLQAGPGGAGSGGNGGNAFVQAGSGGSGGKDGDVQLLAGSGGVNVTSGGNVILTAGIGSSVNGMVVNRGPELVRQGTPTAKTVSATLTAAEVLAGIITVNQGGGAATALQLPTASAMDTAFPVSQAEDAFDFSLINISTNAAEDATVTTNTSWTLVGSMVVESNDNARAASSGLFRARKTGTGAWTLYRLA